MAATCIPVLNYIAFISFYILCFYALSNNNTQLVGYSSLFFVHSAFILYLFSNLMGIRKTRQLGMFAIIILLTVFTAMIIHSIGLALIIMTLMFLRGKYDQQNGTSLQLDQDNSNTLNYFNVSMYSIFGVCAVLLAMFFYDVSGSTVLPIHFIDSWSDPKNPSISKFWEEQKDFMKDPSMSGFGTFFFPFLALVSSAGVLYQCSLQFTEANKISKLYSRDISVGGIV